MTLELSAVLCWIDRENGESTIYQLAANLSRTSNTITRIVDVLERRGLVERHRAQTGDRRLVYVTMTLEGESTLGSFREATFVIIEPILASIGEYELRRSLDQVIDTLSVISGH
jgi:DNA-binding MarR family transcriptional regulator